MFKRAWLPRLLPGAFVFLHLVYFVIPLQWREHDLAVWLVGRLFEMYKMLEVWTWSKCVMRIWGSILLFVDMCYKIDQISGSMRIPDFAETSLICIWRCGTEAILCYLCKLAAKAPECNDFRLSSLIWFSRILRPCFAAAVVMQSEGFTHLEESCPSLLSELLETVASADEKSNLISGKKRSGSSILGLDLAADCVAESVNPNVRRLRRRL